MAKINVHLMIFPEFPASHIELALECKGAFYSMNRWDEAYSAWIQKDEGGNAYEGVKQEGGSWTAIKAYSGNPMLKQQYDNIQAWMDQAKDPKQDNCFSFDIEGDPEELISAWQHYQETMKDKTSRLDENCAESMRRFLNQYAGCSIKKEGLISFPLDVYREAKSQVSKNQQSVDIKDRLLEMSGFDDQLLKLDKHASSLDDRGLSSEAKNIRGVISQFERAADSYQEGSSHKEFQDSCQSIVGEVSSQGSDSSDFFEALQKMRLVTAVSESVSTIKDNALDVTAGEKQKTAFREAPSEEVRADDETGLSAKQ